jgi:hypothetical protein
MFAGARAAAKGNLLKRKERTMKKYVVLAALAAFVCLMAFLSLGKAPDARADDDDDEGAQTTFTFSVASRATAADKKLHQVNLSGCGKFGKKNVGGGGRFNHIIVTATTPRPVVDHGAWKAKKLVSFKSITPTPYGNQLAGILTMKVDLIPDGGPVVKGVTMTVVCNVGAIPAFTGMDEGVTVELDGLTFKPFDGGGVTVLFTGADDD